MRGPRYPESKEMRCLWGLAGVKVLGDSLWCAGFLLLLLRPSCCPSLQGASLSLDRTDKTESFRASVFSPVSWTLLAL